MHLEERFNETIDILRSNKTRDDKILLFLEMIKEKATKIKQADNIVLCGATPFAKKVLRDRNLLFSNNVNIKIEDFDMAKNNSGGEKEDAIYILCSRPNISKHLRVLTSITENIMPYQMLLSLESRYSTNPYAYQYEKVVKQIEDIVDHVDDYYDIYLNLGDLKSKEIFMKMILFRLTYDYRMHSDIATKYPHYFDADVIYVGQEEIFVDCGGYLGDTLTEFRKVTNDHFRKYFLFEPDEKLIDKAKEKGNEKVVFLNKGVWEKETKLYFKEQTAAGNGTFIDKESNENMIEVPVTDLDSNIKEATFIKMDVEGSELMALQGAKNLIGRCRPKLAVCVYHKYKDFRELYDYINQLGKYRIYLRAEMDNVDTELYYLCVPE